MTFNALEYAHQVTELEAGWTDATIDEVTQRTSQAGNVYVSVRFNLDSFGGRKLWTNLNVRHPKDDVKMRAFKELANICIACGFSSLKQEDNPVELEHKRCKIRVDNSRTGEWEIREYKLADDPVRPLEQLAEKSAEAIDDDIPF